MTPRSTPRPSRPPRNASRSGAKSQRWVDLLSALLDRRMPATFAELARDVPAYLGKSKESVKRMFERDKAELLALGVPIRSAGDAGDPDSTYQLLAKDFYLPYLSIATPRGRSTPSRVDRYGYKALTGLTFDADELRLVAEGAMRAGQLGNPSLAADVSSAMRKMAFDMPVDAVTVPDEVRIAPPRSRAGARSLEALGAALHARRTVRFEYHSIGSDATTSRVAEPYGLFFLNAHWYLVARDVERDALRNFRVSRMRAVKETSADRELPDYAIPADFDLRDHARSRQAWELGDHDVLEAVVRFTGASGAARAAASLGLPAGDDADLRRFQVRRVDAFVRWLLSFAGEAAPVAPPEVVAEFRRQVDATRSVYGVEDAR